MAKLAADPVQTIDRADRNPMNKKRIGKWLSYSASIVAAVIVAVLSYAWVWFEIRSSRSFPSTDYEIEIPGDSESIAEGRRLAQTRGCIGCHGMAGEGFLYRTFWDGTRWYAPDLTLLIREYSNAEFVQAVRGGVRPDGTSVVGNMPSDMFQWLSDEDLAKIMAFLMSRQPQPTRPPTTRFGPLARLGVMLAERAVGGAFLAEVVDHERMPVERTPMDPVDLGRYLALSACVQCHGQDLRGMEVFPRGYNPDLAITAAYSVESFRKLMRTGVPLVPRELELMSEVSVYRFSAFSDSEIDALHTYLGSLATSPP